MRFLITFCTQLVYVTLLSTLAHAVSPGVPSLPTTAADYHGYAVTGLPDHFASRCHDLSMSFRIRLSLPNEFGVPTGGHEADFLTISLVRNAKS